MNLDPQQSGSVHPTQPVEGNAAIIPLKKARYRTEDYITELLKKATPQQAPGIGKRADSPVSKYHKYR